MTVRAGEDAEAFVARVATDLTHARQLADTISEALDPDTCAISLVEEGSHWTVEVVFRDPAERERIAQLMQACGAAPDDLRFASLQQRDWVAASLTGLAPVRAGRFVVHGAHDRHRVRDNQIGIEIEAALAFGTGHHGTTRGCLLALTKIAKVRRRRMRILDLGTGSGVLAIAAARLLSAPVLASDIDPIAVKVARTNAQLNRAGLLVETYVAAGAKAHRLRARAPYDLILANILEAPLRRMSHELATLLAPRGQLVLSGLLPAQAAGVISAYRRQGLILVAKCVIEGWVTLVMRR